MVEIKIEKGAEKIISILEESGYEAYAVGGCVRDSVMGKIPNDWDITTSALPETVCEIFKRFLYEVLPTGIKHGTVTVRIDDKNYEVTTFRTESEYDDFRRPKSVNFVGRIEEDLKRRDFTVNAMAYNPKRGLIDLYGGLSDIKNKKIKAVGNPYERFSEDALRILRGARFCSALGFDIDEETLSAMEKLSPNLNKVSVERVWSELEKLLKGRFVKKSLTDCFKVVFSVIPELEKCYKFNQHSKWHKYDVYGHIVESVSNIDDDLVLRLTMLLHDVGKPDKFFMRNGEGHFYGHPIRSKEIAEEVFKRLKVPVQVSKDALFLIEKHDKIIPSDKIKIKKELYAIGEKNFFNLMKVKNADNKAQATEIALEENLKVRQVEQLAKEIVENGECYKLEDLKVDGKDVIKFGFSGKKVGEILQSILFDVINGNLKNDREVLLKSLERRKGKSGV